jgi:hypothetical protein
MWMNVEIFCFIVTFYVASLASPQIWKKKPWYEVACSARSSGKSSPNPQPSRYLGDTRIKFCVILGWYLYDTRMRLWPPSSGQDNGVVSLMRLRLWAWVFGDGGSVAMQRAMARCAPRPHSTLRVAPAGVQLQPQVYSGLFHHTCTLLISLHLFAKIFNVS